jgi:hypothetical protein
MIKPLITGGGDLLPRMYNHRSPIPRSVNEPYTSAEVAFLGDQMTRFVSKVHRHRKTPHLKEKKNGIPPGFIIGQENKMSMVNAFSQLVPTKQKKQHTKAIVYPNTLELAPSLSLSLSISESCRNGYN